MHAFAQKIALCLLCFSPNWLILLAVSSLYSGSNCVQLPQIRLCSANLPPTSESFLFGKQQQTSYPYICSSSTVRKVTLVEQYMQRCKTEFGEDTSQARKCWWATPRSRGSHSVSKLGKLLSPASFNLFSSRISPSSLSSHIMYTCDFARRRRLQTSSASLGLPCCPSSLPLMVSLSPDCLLMPSLQAYHQTSFETQQLRRDMRNADSGTFRPREGHSWGSPSTTMFSLDC